MLKRLSLLKPKKMNQVEYLLCHTED